MASDPIRTHAFDLHAQPDDFVHVEIVRDGAGGFKVYVHLNGFTVCRIGHIPRPNLSLEYHPLVRATRVHDSARHV